MLTATLQERMAAQVAERRETGRPLQAGDLVHARSEFREVVTAGNACECAEARVELVQQFLSAVVRWVLTGLGAWFVQKGILEGGQATELIAGGTVALVALLWSLWQKFTSKREAFTLAAMKPGATLQEAQASIARGIAAPAGTGAGDVPVLVNTNTGDSVKPRLWFLPLLLVGALSAGAVTGCASLSGTVTPNPTVDQVQAVRNQAATLAKATKEAATLAVEARRLAQTGYDNKLLPASAMQKINTAAIVASEKGLAFITFAETVTVDPSLRVTALELLLVFDDFILSLTNAGQSGAAIRAALAAFRAYLGVQ
jgi:hypothetical protein